MGILEFWVILIALGFCLLAQVLNSQNFTCISNDLKALRDFVSAVESPIGGWDTDSSSNCCNWVGITCKSSSSLGLNDPLNSSRVVHVELGQGRLRSRSGSCLADCSIS
ncbi:unnamed protein product [Ilex paraguariensis]|uniref:Leucine-rich repeat-containing N-terminal plant-type domain-containing protein n=1 Tax=Ilex paraguariensis TaxID=185542 RepID=A0ABC8T9K2_9AQUA